MEPIGHSAAPAQPHLYRDGQQEIEDIEEPGLALVALLDHVHVEEAEEEVEGEHDDDGEGDEQHGRQLVHAAPRRED